MTIRADGTRDLAYGNYDGSTYYGRAQLKPAPFNVWMVGGYIFLAGLSGAAALIGGAAQLDQVRRRKGHAPP